MAAMSFLCDAGEDEPREEKKETNKLLLTDGSHILGVLLVILLRELY